MSAAVLPDPIERASVKSSTTECVQICRTSLGDTDDIVAIVGCRQTVHLDWCWGDKSSQLHIATHGRVQTLAIKNDHRLDPDRAQLGKVNRGDPGHVRLRVR